MNCFSLLRRPLAIVGATLFDGAGIKRLAESVLVVDNHRVVAVGSKSAVPLPPNAEVVDAAGKWLVPGLIDLHTHLDEDISPAGWLLHGVTSVRDVGSRLVTIEKWRGRAAKGDRLPRVFWMGRNIDEGAPSWSGAVAVKNAAGVTGLLKDMHERQGVDGVKLYTAAGPNVARAVIAEAHRRGLPVTGHLKATRPSAAAALGIDNLEHVAVILAELKPREKPEQSGFGASFAGIAQIDLTSRAVQDLIGALARNQVAVTPTIALNYLSVDGELPAAQLYEGWTTLPAGWRTWWKDRYWDFLSTRGWNARDYATARQAREKYLRFLGALHRAGVPIVAGTDTPAPWVLPGAGLHLELEMYVRAGLSTAAALHTATGRAAAVLGTASNIGVLKPGAYADFLLLDADPLQDIRNLRRISAVYQSGYLVDREKLRRDFLAARKGNL